MDFENYHLVSKKRLIEHINGYFRNRKKQNIPQLFKDEKFLESLSGFVVRGKFLRGTLFLMAVEGLGGKINKSCLDTACAIELVHSGLLIQDDVIDNDYSRRGINTVFAEYEKRGKEMNASNPYHYGVSQAIVISDIAFFFAMDLIANSKNDLISDLLKKFMEEIYMVILAEGVDSFFGQTEEEPTRNEIEDVYKFKTARYTFALPLQMANIVCKSSDANQKILEKIGELVGFIFQLKDDEIGLLGSEEKIGKPVGSDIRENKKTLIRYYLFKKANANNKRRLDILFGNSNIGNSEINEIRSMYADLGIQDLVNQEIELRMKDVWKYYEKLKFKKKYKTILKELIEYNIKRSF